MKKKIYWEGQSINNVYEARDRGKALEIRGDMLGSAQEELGT